MHGLWVSSDGITRPLKMLLQISHFMANSYAQISDDQSSSRDDSRVDVCSQSIISQLNSFDVPSQTPETDDAPSNEEVRDHPDQNRNASTIAPPFLHVHGSSQGCIRIKGSWGSVEDELPSFIDSQLSPSPKILAARKAWGEHHPPPSPRSPPQKRVRFDESSIRTERTQERAQERAQERTITASERAASPLLWESFLEVVTIAEAGACREVDAVAAAGGDLQVNWFEADGEF